MTDFEVGLRNACRTMVPDARLSGCHVHFERVSSKVLFIFSGKNFLNYPIIFLQLILAKFKSLGLTCYVKENDEARFYLKSILALPFLPHEEIENQFNNKSNALSPWLRDRLRAFIKYFKKQWLRQIGVRGFSVFGLQDRTNNVLESFHAVLLRNLGPHPATWDFFSKTV